MPPNSGPVDEDSRLKALRSYHILDTLPEPTFAIVRRWPDSLPLYAVGHLERIQKLDTGIAQLPHIRLIGNAYRGVGLPDLIRDGRNAARDTIAGLASV